MITISIIGVEPPLGRQISKQMNGALAELYELTREDFYYILPECFYVNNGVEQNMWNILVRVNAPHKYHSIEVDVLKVIRSYLKPFCSSMAVEFYYYDEDHRYEFVDEDQPKFVTEENSVYAVDDDFELEELEEDNHDEHHHHEDDDIFLGNAFEELGHFKGED